MKQFKCTCPTNKNSPYHLKPKVIASNEPGAKRPNWNYDNDVS